MSINLTKPTLDQIHTHCVSAYPHECCGALIGKTVAGVNQVNSIVALANSEPNNPERRFVIDPAELNRVEKDARANSESVIGFYHSHPDAPARPSATDREWAWESYSYIIVSVAKGEVSDTKSYQLNGGDEDSVFEAEQIAAYPVG